MNNMQVAVHAIGDAANAEVLDAIAAQADTYKGDRRWRIEHAQIVDPADIPRFAQLGVIASMQPVHETSDARMAEARLGPARLAGAYAWASMLRNNVRLAFGTDYPVESPDPWAGWAAAFTRQDANGEPYRRLAAAGADHPRTGVEGVYRRCRLCRVCRGQVRLSGARAGRRLHRHRPGRSVVAEPDRTAAGEGLADLGRRPRKSTRRRRP